MDMHTGATNESVCHKGQRRGLFRNEFEQSKFPSISLTHTDIQRKTESYLPVELTTASTTSETSSVRDSSIAWVGDLGAAVDDVPGLHALLPECILLAAVPEQEDEALDSDLLKPAVVKYEK